MEKRMNTNSRLVGWIVHKVKTEYPNDIALVLLYGSYINGSANSRSDVDCYFIPKTERGYALARTFILDGVGYDIFPMTWERVAGIADLQETLSPLVGDVRIVYCNSAEDAQRFHTLQERLKHNLEDDAFVQKAASDRCQAAGKLCAMLARETDLCQIRKTAGRMIMMLADAVAVYHHEYYHFGLKKQFEDLQNCFSADIAEGYRKVIEAGQSEEIAKHAMKLYRDVCCHLHVPCLLPESVETEKTAAGSVDASYLAGLYEEICSTFNKIYVCCEAGNHILAFLSAVCLQRDLDEAREAGCPDYDLLRDFSYEALWKLSAAAQKIEADLVRLITESGGHIRKYDSMEQFEAAK